MNNNKKIQSCLGKNKSNWILQNPSLKPQIKVGILFFSYPKQNLTLQCLPKLNWWISIYQLSLPSLAPPLRRTGHKSYIVISQYLIYLSITRGRGIVGKAENTFGSTCVEFLIEGGEEEGENREGAPGGNNAAFLATCLLFFVEQE